MDFEIQRILIIHKTLQTTIPTILELEIIQEIIHEHLLEIILIPETLQAVETIIPMLQKIIVCMFLGQFLTLDVRSMETETMIMMVSKIVTIAVQQWLEL